MLFTFEKDKEWIESKYHKKGEPFNPLRRMAHHGHDFDPATGILDEEIKEGLQKLSVKTASLPHPVAKAHAVAYVLQHTRIAVDARDYFVGIYSLNRLIADTTVRKWRKEVFEQRIPHADAKMKQLNACGAVAIAPDFDHVVPDWNAVLTLGFSGLRERARQYRAWHESRAPLTEEQAAYFDSMEIEYSAILAFLDRLYRYAAAQTHEKAPRIAACLLHLRDGAPTNIYEAMQLIFLFFLISECIEYYQVRSLGNGLDFSLYPFYCRDLENGTFTREEIKELLRYFLMQWSAIGNFWNQPFYLGGRDADGKPLANRLTYDILDVYDEMGIYNPKIQIKYDRDTPRALTDKVLDMIRRGHSCFVFCCEPALKRAAMSYGATEEEARTLDIRGCYETGVRANEVCADSGTINPAKALLYVLYNGKDPTTGVEIGKKTGELADFHCFDQIYQAFLAQVDHLIDTSAELSCAYDPYLCVINPSPMYSATVESSLQKVFDGYGGGVKYNNSSLLNSGYGTAIDALLAIRYLVFEKNLVSLTELKNALEQNWVGYEGLRLAALRCPYKYGSDNALANSYAAGFCHFFANRVNGRKNGRGGVFKAAVASAMEFVWQGEHTEATPDGRFAGAELSKNASPTPGMDKDGVTALILAASNAGTPYTEAFCLDVMLHPSTVQGEGGLAAMKSLLDVYCERGGMNIQFNVFDADTLRDAQLHPERYESLQVRVAGWNVLWNTLSKKEQDAYILRAECIQA